MWRPAPYYMQAQAQIATDRGMLCERIGEVGRALSLSSALYNASVFRRLESKLTAKDPSHNASNVAAASTYKQNWTFSVMQRTHLSHTIAVGCSVPKRHNPPEFAYHSAGVSERFPVTSMNYETREKIVIRRT